MVIHKKIFHFQAKLRHKLQSIENDPQLDTTEKSKRKQNLLLLHSIGSPGMMNTANSPSSHVGLGTLGTSPSTTAAMSPHAPSFYPAGETVESVIGIFMYTSFVTICLRLSLTFCF